MVRGLILHHTVNSGLEKTKPFFEDFKQFSEFHPLFIGIEEAGPGKFIIHERMPVTSIKFKYRAEIINKPETNEVVYIAYPFFLTLTINFRFSEAGSGRTNIVELVTIKGPILMVDILKSLVKKMHIEIIVRINKKIR